MEKGKIIKIAGPLVVAIDIPQAKMLDIVKVGNEELTGEIIQMRENKSWIQVYEDTAGVNVGEPVYSTLEPMSLILGPGLLTQFYDGIQRPLSDIADQSGIYIKRGINTSPLDMEKEWEFNATKKKGDNVSGGDVLGTVKETRIVEHKILTPTKIEGEVTKIESGKFKLKDPIAKVKDEHGTEHDVFMYQIWPIRKPRPNKRKLAADTLLVTGQRVVDTFFPLLKGGTAISPGPFGSGKSVIQHQLAKWSDAQIVVYVGCGERGNEMTDLLVEFPELKDPNTGHPLMERSVLIANTSNMPIAAREASIYTGITIAEYYRDMGYDVALMADSTSRWAEALREMSGRLEEMPGEEGYPAYLASRISEFYERAGRVECAGDGDRVGSVSVVGAVSPGGGDLSEPVTQGSLQVTKVFWALDANLANARHYPSINWLNSYSQYTNLVDKQTQEHVNPEFPRLRNLGMQILQREADLQEIIKVVGLDSLSNEDRVVMDTAKSIREDYLQQNAFDEIDAYSSLQKQFLILKSICTYHEQTVDAVRLYDDININLILANDFKDQITKFKYMPETEIESIKGFIKKIPEEIDKIVQESVAI